MKKITLSMLLIMMASVLIASVGLAQDQKTDDDDMRGRRAQAEFNRGGSYHHGGYGGPRAPHCPEGPGQQGGPFDGEAREAMEAFRLFKLTEALELSEEQTSKIYPRMAELNKLRDEHRETNRAKMDELDKLVENDKFKKAAKLANELNESRWQHMQLIHEKEQGVFELLSGEQQARFVLFQKQFHGHLRNVKEKMMHRRMNKPGTPRGPRGG